MGEHHMSNMLPLLLAAGVSVTAAMAVAPASAAEVQLTCAFQNAIPPVTDAAAKEWHDSGLHLGIVSTASAEFRL